ncbi:glycerol-3-phosphate acyltransferase 1, mitochondrial isoform X2 [Phlebotomus argentipes]|nr:glycerol-3-phosphate acyltransferase 1, mitochondrial isoform X2 [Phlebotomus argentipes]
MVDVMSTRLQEVYGSWTYNGFGWGDGGQRVEERPTFDFLRRFGEQQRRKRAQERETDRRTRENYLYEIKESTMQMPTTAQNLPQGLACRSCAPGSEIQLDPHERRRDVIDVLRTTQHANQGPNRSNYDWGTWFPILAQCLRVRKYHFPEVSPIVLEDERVKSAIDQAAIQSVREERQAAEAQGKAFSDTETYTEMLERHNKRARKVMMDMRSKLSNVLLQITSWLIYKILPCFLTGAVAHPAQIEMLKAASRRSPDTPLIFLPLHRSHLDYVLVTFMLLNNDLRVPVIAAGQNLRIPFFGWALRGLGAFYIKRKIDPVTGQKDIVYRAILHSYLQHCLTAGHNAEFFIEGGRTRTGKPCIPKGGILSVVVEAFMEKALPDVLLVPVSVNYERLVDGNFVAEHLGQRKPPETFMSAISAIWKAVKSNYGLMRIDFNEPFSLRELVDAFKRNQERELPSKAEPGDRLLQQTKSSTSLYGTDIVQEDNRALVDSIARHVVYDCASATTVMSTNAVTFLLLTRYRCGVTLSVLTQALDDLREDLHGMKDMGFTGESRAIIEYVINLLGTQLITTDTSSGEMFLKPVNTVPAMLELSYYANTLMPFYVLESVITTAIYALLPPTEMVDDSMSLLEEDVLALCHKFCDILRYEFILNKPCQDLDTLLHETLFKMRDRDLISIPKKNYTEAELDAQRVHRTLLLNNDLDDDDEELYHFAQTDENVVVIDKNQRHQHINSIAILAPIARTYLTVVDYLHRLLGNAQLEVEFVKGALSEIRQQFDNQECEFGESVSVEMIKNCLKLLEKWSVVQVECAGGVRLLSLTHHYSSSAGIEEVYQRIQTFNCVHRFNFSSN